MSLTIDQNIGIKCPDLFNDANKAKWVTNAQLSIDADCYGNKYNLAVALRACHDFTLTDIQQGSGAGASGSIISKREGDQALAFSNNASNISGDDYLKLTNYGLELLSIQKGTISRFDKTGNTDDAIVICCTGY